MLTKSRSLWVLASRDVPASNKPDAKFRAQLEQRTVKKCIWCDPRPLLGHLAIGPHRSEDSRDRDDCDPHAAQIAKLLEERLRFGIRPHVSEIASNADIRGESAARVGNH